jgi:hypothetical protein
MVRSSIMMHFWTGTTTNHKNNDTEKQSHSMMKMALGRLLHHHLKQVAPVKLQRSTHYHMLDPTEKLNKLLFIYW